MPPVNANENLTDEDSGDQNELSINNLPPSQLLAEADIMKNFDIIDAETQDEWDEDDDKPYVLGVKRKLHNKLVAEALSRDRFEHISYGYVTFFDLYQDAKSKIEKYSSLGLGPSLVLTYADTKLSKINAPYYFYFDNSFTAVALLEELSLRKIKTTDTIRENRRTQCPLPTNKIFKKQQRGTYDHRVTNNKSIIVTAWNDNNIVNIASNSTNVFPVHQVSRYSRSNKKRIMIEQPHIIHVMYNKFIEGVNKSDQNISLYRTDIRGITDISRKNKKRWTSAELLALLEEDDDLMGTDSIDAMYNLSPLTKLRTKKIYPYNSIQLEEIQTRSEENRRTL
ncbi:hypothetical protein ILUMI_01568 [Ignelater luminosus]|uniref:PiggyBac transposable element-derived protein domain-containing protein n=1 Tax=Ignelater luminosus TaxID=2038154 RepID=A0A8K0GM43_IGNLU|nr:hypothetical protein ILUMI_01568 [Ignelater luminosus]